MAKVSNKPAPETLKSVLDTLPKEVVLPAGYTLGRRMTAPLISLTYNQQLIIQVEGEMSSQDSAKATTEGGKPMVVVPIINMADGEFMHLIVPTVLESAFTRVPGGYVGKRFLVHQGPKPIGKRYFSVELYEVSGGPARAGG